MIVRLVFASVAFLITPRPALCQEVDGPSTLRLDARLGFAGHDGGLDAGGVTAYQGEIALRTRGPIVLGIGAGIIHTSDFDVAGTGHETEFQGQNVEISGGSSTFQGSPRFRGLAGYAFEFRTGMYVEPTIEGGVARMRGRDKEWQPWGVGALAVRGSSGFGFQLGIGRHRVGREYRSFETGALVRSFHTWENFTELLVSVPLN
jgi:hypothetical protein